MSRKLLLILTFAFLSPVFVFAQNEGGGPQERRQFLFNLGFNDVPAIIKTHLQNRDYLTELNRRQMQANIESYEVINAARELSILILNNRPADDALALFSAKMLALKPLSPTTDYPTNILKMPEGEEREEALVEWLREARIQQMNSHKSKILSDIVTLLYGTEITDHKKDIKQIDNYLTTIIECLYLDDTIGNGRYFGRALTALMLREDLLRPHDQRGFKKVISEELTKRYALNLNNFFGDTMVFQSPDGEKKHKIENGTMMLSRNLSSGSLTISWAAIPKKLKARWKARFAGLIGTPLAKPFYVTPQDTSEGISLWMRIRDRIAQGGILREGFSHISYYIIKEDPKSGIQMPMVVDNYPNRVFDETLEYVRTGGTRLTFPEQVIDPSHHAAVYFSNPIAEKTQEWSQKSVTKNGYEAEFFPSIEVELDGTEPVKNDRVVNWKTTITRDEFENLHGEQNAKKLSKNIWQRYADGLIESVYQGWIFHWPDPYDFYLIGATYCSQLGDMVMRKFVGMPLEASESVWHWALRYIANIGKLGEKLKANASTKKIGEKLLKLPGVEKAMKMTGIKIIAPTSLVLQPFMKGEFIRFGSRTPEQRAQSSYMFNEYREEDPKLTTTLDSKIKLNRFEDRPRNYVLDYGAAMRDFEYGTVMRASNGLKTLKFSTETMAEIGTAKEFERQGYGKNSCNGLF